MNTVKRIAAFITALLLTLPLCLAAAAPAGETRRTPRDGEPIVIDTVEILGFTAPEWGAHPDFGVTVPEGRGYYLDYNNWFWYILGVDNGRMTEDDLFIDDKCCYYQEFEIRCFEGYTIADDALVLINGDPDLVDSAAWSFNAPMFVIDTVDFTVEEPDVLLGDMDGNGLVSVTDALIVLRLAMGVQQPSEGQSALADVDNSGSVTVSDALLVLRRAMNLIDHFPIEE